MPSSEPRGRDSSPIPNASEPVRSPFSTYRPSRHVNALGYDPWPRREVRISQ